MILRLSEEYINLVTALPASLYRLGIGVVYDIQIKFQGPGSRDFLLVAGRQSHKRHTEDGQKCNLFHILPILFFVKRIAECWIKIRLHAARAEDRLRLEVNDVALGLCVKLFFFHKY